jgi:hypothetical protein
VSTKPDAAIARPTSAAASAGHEQPERREQRPHVGLPAVAERMSAIARPSRPSVGEESVEVGPELMVEV